MTAFLISTRCHWFCNFFYTHGNKHVSRPYDNHTWLHVKWHDQCASDCRQTMYRKAVRPLNLITSVLYLFLCIALAPVYWHLWKLFLNAEPQIKVIHDDFIKDFRVLAASVNSGCKKCACLWLRWAARQACARANFCDEDSDIYGTELWWYLVFSFFGVKSLYPWMVSNQSTTPMYPIIVSLSHMFWNCELEHETELLFLTIILFDWTVTEEVA